MFFVRVVPVVVFAIVAVSYASSLLRDIKAS